MHRKFDFDRRKLLAGSATSAAALMLGGCDDANKSACAKSFSSTGDSLTRSACVDDVLHSANALNENVQRWITSPTSLAPEYAARDLSRVFKPNGSTSPDSDAYRASADKKFADWSLEIAGLVEHPQKIALQKLREMPSRTQITRHDCVEGWSCIGKWKGVQLSQLLLAAKLKPTARFIVFRCADSMGNSLEGPQLYYESINLEDAFHPQTILAYEMNDAPLPVANGAPLRLRVERQLGYKMAKYVMKIEAVDALDGIGDGKGGYWEDQGYSWWAGI